MIYSLKAKLNVLIRPIWWIRNQMTDKVWDTVLLDILKSGEFEFSGYGHYSVELKDKRTNRSYSIWITNYPYAYATYRDFYPSRTTAMLFKKELDKFNIKEMIGK